MYSSSEHEWVNKQLSHAFQLDLELCLTVIIDIEAEQTVLEANLSSICELVSTDELKDNKAFAEKYNADFPLLSDPEGTVADAYDVSFMGYAKRHTFYIDKTGKIVMIDKNVRPKTSAEDMAKYMAKLDFEPSKS